MYFEHISCILPPTLKFLLSFKLVYLVFFLLFCTPISFFSISLKYTFLNNLPACINLSQLFAILLWPLSQMYALISVPVPQFSLWKKDSPLGQEFKEAFWVASCSRSVIRSIALLCDFGSNLDMLQLILNKISDDLFPWEVTF